MFSNHALAAHVADTVREPLLVLDGDLRVLAANRAFYRTFLLAPEDTRGVTVGQLGRGQWSDSALRTLLDDVLYDKLDFEGHEVAGEFPGVGRRLFSLSGRRVHGLDEGAGTILLALEDITERRAIEETLAQRTRELEASNLELEQFAAVASHDLQEPLRKIRTFGDLLRKRHVDGLNAEALDYIERMWQAAGRMQSLIDALLSLSRIHVRDAAPGAVDLNAIVREVLTDLEVTLREAEGTVDVGELPTVVADPIQVRQLFQNLLSNAVKFRRMDTPLAIRVTSHAAPGTTASVHAMHEVVIRDNGIGFAQRYADQIFAPFTRLHGRSEYAGAGIGLAICRRIVERHGGTIRAEGAVGAGATFVFTLATPTPSALEALSQASPTVEHP